MRSDNVVVVMNPIDAIVWQFAQEHPVAAGVAIVVVLGAWFWFAWTRVFRRKL